MTHYIAHRINTVSELIQVPSKFGVEIDLRDEAGEIILQHDPFLPKNVLTSDLFVDFLKKYNHGTLILNIKSERIEHKVLDQLKAFNITDYFFLDSSFPMIYLMSNLGENNFALRYSECEGIDTIRSMKGKVNWVWVDCFSKLPINKIIYDEIKGMGYKVCLVSPELQGRPEDIEPYKVYLNDNDILFDAICTKIYNIDAWHNM